MKLNYKRTFIVGFVFLSISLLNGVHDSSTNVILLQKFGLGNVERGLIMAIDNILALFMLPLFGKLSDNSNSKFGKRKPFVLFGTLSACAFLMLFPVANQMDNLLFFIIAIFLFLFALGTYRSAGVSLVSDVTIKPLRSKANAIINLMGAVAFVLGNLATLLLFKSPDKVTGVRAIPLTYYYLAFVVMTVIALIVYLFKVDEVKLSKDREKIEDELHLEDDDIIDGTKIKMPKKQWISLGLILLSIAMWTFAYNAATTNYSVYAGIVLGTKDGGFALPTLVAGVTALIAYVPIGMLATKIGRRKTILLGLLLALVCLTPAVFVRSEWAIILVFAFFGIAQAMIVVNTLPMVMEFANKNTNGQLTGIYYVATQMAQALTPLLAGVVMNFFSAELGNGLGGQLGMLALFPYSAFFVFIAIIPMLFVKYGDSKPLPAASKLEMLDN
ncbi:MAG: MFS transporter [Clostridia bacterium]